MLDFFHGWRRYSIISAVCLPDSVEAAEGCRMMRSWHWHSFRILIGVVFGTLLYSAVDVWMTSRREQRIAHSVRSFDCLYCWTEYCGPQWIPQSYRHSVPASARITEIGIVVARMTPGPPPDPESVQEADLQELLGELRSLSNLRKLGLNRLKISDSSMVHLKELKGLTELILEDTNVTVEGIAELQEALPTCRIFH
jgi:hypothetical protein